MKKYDNLYEKIVTFPNLLDASRKALRGKKHKSGAARFYFHMEEELLKIQEELAGETYRPGDYRDFEIYEPKKRTICAAPFRDRVVHHAICNIIEPLMDKALIYDSYACRKNKGVHKAVKRAQYFTRRWKYFLKCDINKFFETIDREILKKQLKSRFKDQKLMKLLEIIIDHPVPGYNDGRGLPIGNLTSQNFSNYYIGSMDHFIKEQLYIKGYVRYMDDFLLFSDDKKYLWECLKAVREYLRALKLSIKEKGLLLSPVPQGVPFLGFRIFPSLMRLKRDKWVRFMGKVGLREKEYLEGNIHIKDLSLSVGSMTGHIIHGATLMARRKFFN